MSWKSLGLSILSLLVTVGLLFGTWFLFAANIVLGIIGIVLLIVVPIGIGIKALNEARGLIDRVFAKYIIPIVTLIVSAMSVMMIIGLIPFPFQ